MPVNVKGMRRSGYVVSALGSREKAHSWYDGRR